MLRATFDDPGLTCFVQERGSVLHIANKDFMEG